MTSAKEGKAKMVVAKLYKMKGWRIERCFFPETLPNGRIHKGNPHGLVSESDLD